MPNSLVHETSPYLQQHAENPVNWFPWGAEALAKSKEEDKPIFLSIGYSACHWCHVMAHESFEEPEIADLLNQYFVSIKVDREERPDLDSIYMNAVVAMTGQGGWPMSVFLTPSGEPFYGGTYFPPTRRFGMPAFKEILLAVEKAWREDRSGIQKTASSITQQLIQAEIPSPARGSGLRVEILDQAVRGILSSYDWKQGGWGKAPRFPQPMTIEFLLMQSVRSGANLKEEALQAVVHVLKAMSQGGMYDVVGGGFHRYSTDNQWLVPHFEKMLYDNGQLALVYLHAYLLTGILSFRRTCEETLDFLLREMHDEQGGFYSSLDADSEGEEGKYYVWTPVEVDQALPDLEDRQFFDRVYAISEQGNFEGKNILQRRANPEQMSHELGMIEGDFLKRLEGVHRQLYAFREQRVRPGTDDKVLVSWNALALKALAEAARFLNREDYLAAARQNASFILEQMMPGDSLQRAWRAGKARHNAYLEDHAALITALVSLYETDFDLRWFRSAQALAEKMTGSFQDSQGAFYDTPSDQAGLITRPRDLQDNATPSGSALAANALLHLSALQERPSWRQAAEEMIQSMGDFMTKYPTSFGYWLQAVDFLIGPVQQVAIVAVDKAPNLAEFLAYLRSAYRPRMVTAVSNGNSEDGQPELLHERGLIEGQPTVYVCQGFVCSLPVTDLAGLKRQIEPHNDQKARDLSP